VDPTLSTEFGLVLTRKASLFDKRATLLYRTKKGIYSFFGSRVDPTLSIKFGLIFTREASLFDKRAEQIETQTEGADISFLRPSLPPTNSMVGSGDKNTCERGERTRKKSLVPGADLSALYCRTSGE
jgi:hypothetical protein